MSAEKTKFETFGSGLKDVISALRDSVLFLLFIILLFAPSLVKDRLSAAGFKKGSIAGLEWEAQIQSAAEQTKEVAETVIQASENYKTVIEHLNELENQVNDPSIKAFIRNIGNLAETSQTELSTADRALKRSFAIQQKIVKQVNPSAFAESGWITLGRVSENRNSWISHLPPLTVDRTNARLLPGTKLKATEDIYLHAKPAEMRSPITGVVKEGETIEVIEVNYIRSRAGGWQYWARVQRR